MSKPNQPHKDRETQFLHRPQRQSVLDRIIGPPRPRPGKPPTLFRRWLGWACAGAGAGVVISILTGAAVITTPITILFGLIEIGTQTGILWGTVTLFAILGGGLLGLLAFLKHRA